MMKILIKISIILIGAALGFSFYFFIGCKSGTCPMTSNPWISTLYGGIIGLVLTWGKKDKKE